MNSGNNKVIQTDISTNVGNKLIAYSKNINRETINFINNIQETDNKEDIINNNFKWLESSLLDNQRILTNLDFYKIVGSVNQENVQTVFNDMIHNTSVIVNSNCFLNGVEYATGDLIYKQSNGQPQSLKLGGGLYFPKFGEDANNPAYIRWELSDKTPHRLPNDEYFDYSNPDGKDPNIPYERYQVQLSSTGELSYSEIIEGPFDEDIKISKENLQIEGKDIIPVVKGYQHIKIDNKDFDEEILWDFYLIKKTEKINDLKKQYWYIHNISIPSILTKIVVK